MSRHSPAKPEVEGSPEPGAIGGMVVYGIVGLFVGAVFLALGWDLTVAWLKGDEEENEEAEPAPAPA